MKNLENYGVQEMGAMETQSIDGGFLLTLPLTGFALGYLYEKYIA